LVQILPKAPNLAHVILFGFLMSAKMGASRSCHIGKIQNGRHPGEVSIAV